MAPIISSEQRRQLLDQLDSWPATYRHIPQSVVLHAREVIRGDIACSLLRSLGEEPSGTPQALDRLFQNAGTLVGLSSGQLVQAADWNPDDLDPNRFDAMLAELRTIVWLSQESFAHIRLLPSKGQRKADITADKGRTKYAVEVACVTGWRPPGHERRSQELKQVLLDKYDEKKPQLDATAARQGCQARALVSVFVGLDQVAMMTREGYLEQGLKPAWYALGSPSDTHLAVMAHESDNCVFPPW